MEANFIPFPRAYADLFIDVMDGEHDVFTPEIINQVNNDNEGDHDLHEE